MTTVADVAEWLERFARSELAESWDNVGLLWGDPSASADRIMTCLTVTPTTTDEALESRAGMIVSHHPILFQATRRLRADRPETGFLWKLARNGIAVASPHTAFDNTQGGINEILCERLGILDPSSLRPIGVEASAGTFKVVVFTPEPDREAVRASAFAAGAGVIGDYRECSFAISGQGTFFGTEATNPAIGQKGRRETVDELRLEFVCPAGRIADVLAAVRSSHSYEEPAIDVYPLHQESSVTVGAGRVGMLKTPTSLGEFAAIVARTLGDRGTRFVGNPGHEVRRVAVCCGAGDDFLKDAARTGADVLLTGEARFHRGLEAEAIQVGLIVAGHHATERIGVEILGRKIASAFPEAEVWASRTEVDPFRLVAI